MEEEEEYWAKEREEMLKKQVGENLEKEKTPPKKTLKEQGRDGKFNKYATSKVVCKLCKKQSTYEDIEDMVFFDIYVNFGKNGHFVECLLFIVQKYAILSFLQK